MSTPVDQLRALLGRVEDRRKGPRLRTVPAALGPAAPSNEARPVERISAPPERAKPKAPSPLETAVAGGLSPTPVPGRHGSGELVLDDFEPPQTSVSRAPARGGDHAHRTAPTVPQTDPFANDPFASAPPPPPTVVAAPPAARQAAAPAPAAKAAPPTAPTARVAAPEPVASGPVARAMTRARVETPRTFGELLELSLSLRPRD